MENYFVENCNNENINNALSRVTLIDETLTGKIIEKNLMPTFDLKKGDVLQIISCDKTFMQVIFLTQLLFVKISYHFI